MPFARPASSPSHSSSNGSPPIQTKLATPWDSGSMDRQLESMRQAAAASSSSYSSGAGSSSIEGWTPGSTWTSQTLPSAFSPADEEGLNATSFSTTRPSQSSTTTEKQNRASSQDVGNSSSRRAMKQRLFQISDDEEEVVTPESSDRAHAERLAGLRANRNDPVRRSISAMSGVTVIGRGSGHDRDRQGSTSSLGSSNGFASGRDNFERRPSDLGQSTVMEQTRSLHEPPTSNTLQVDGRQASNAQAFDMPSALELLQMYPRSASPPRNFDDQPPVASTSARPQTSPKLSQVTGYFQPPPRSSSISPHPISPTTHPSQPESSKPRLRRHSRSSNADSTFVLSPVTQAESAEQLHKSPSASSSTSPRHLSPVGERNSQDLNAYSFGQQYPRSASSPSGFEPSMKSGGSRPSRHTSRRSSRVSEHDGNLSQENAAKPGSRSASTNDLSQIMRSFSARRRRSGSKQSTFDLPHDKNSPDNSATISQSSSSNPLRRSTRGANASASNLRDLIQQKRRQVSGPFHNMVSSSMVGSGNASPVISSGTTSPVLGSGQDSNTNGRQPMMPARRARSRHTSGAALGGLSLSLTGNGFEEARLRALRGMGEVVMTPSVEEWRQLGLHESLNERSDSDSSGSDSDTDSSGSRAGDAKKEAPASPPLRQPQARKPSTSALFMEEDDDEADMPNNATVRPRLGSITTFNQYYGSVPPASAQDKNVRDAGSLHRDGTSSLPSLSRSASGNIKRSPKKRELREIFDDSDRDRDVSDTSASAIGDLTDSEVDLKRVSQRDSLPTLSRQSLSVPSGTTIPGYLTPEREGNEKDEVASNQEIQDQLQRNGAENNSAMSSLDSSPIPPFSPSRPSSPVPLSALGPVDPRAYSAVTGLRSVRSFAVQAEAGKGAYGLVRKVKEVNPEGKPFGPDLMLKYIVKQRILADAYKRHKMLGAIPMEIHVLDFLRRTHRGSAGASQGPRDPISNIKRLHGIPVPFPSPTPSPAPAARLPGSPDKLGPAAAIPTSAEQASGQTSYGHPNLCQMLDFFEDNENYYLVMSCFGNGQDLFDYVDAAPTGLSIIESRSILSQIVDAVAFLHSHGIVHRDIKDENIILDGKGGVQLIDFGSAAYIKEGKPYFDTFSGTLDFASPEVLRGERYGGKETDVWALGVLAYVIICGECPFWSSEESLAGLVPGSRPDIALHAKAEEDEIADENVHLSHGASGSADNDSSESLIRWAVDFVHQCLQVHARERPPATQLRKHKFIEGASGWTGKKGWEKAMVRDSPESSSAESS